MKQKTRLAVVGFGLVGKRHSQVIANEPEMELVAVADPTDCLEEAESLGAKYFSGLKELIDSVDVEGIILATPTPQHVEQALRCIEAGIPVLIEKPIAISAEEAIKIVTLSATKEVPVMVGHHRRFNAIIRAAKRAVDEGAIGDLRAVTSTCWLYKPDTYFDEAPWRTQAGAGPISVNLVHDVDLLRHFCGEVVQVQAVSRLAIRGYENEDLAAAILNFQSGAVATVTVSDAIAAPWSWELTANENPVYHTTDQNCYQIGGSLGSLSIPDLKLWRHDEQPDWWSPIHPELLITEDGDPLIAQIRHFHDVILGNASPLVSALEGTRSLQVVEAIQNASKRGAAIDLVPLEEPQPSSSKNRIDHVA